MMGREAYKNPGILVQVDSKLHGELDPLPNQRSVIEAMLPYIEQELSRGAVLGRITCPHARVVSGYAGRQTMASLFKKTCPPTRRGS